MSLIVVGRAVKTLIPDYNPLLWCTVRDTRDNCRTLFFCLFAKGL